MIIPRPNVEELARRFRSEISYRALGGAPVLPMSIEDVMSYVFAGAMFETYGAVEQFYSELDPETASCNGLYAWARRRGLFPTGATSSRGFITVTGIPFASVPLTSTWVTDAGLIYAVDPLSGPITLNAGGVGVVPIRATTAGLSSNVSGGGILSIVQTTPGLDVQATATVSGLSGGSDLEGCEEFRQRILFLRRRGILSPNQDWVLSQIYRWPGLTRACFVDCNSCFNDSFVEIAVFFDGVYNPNGVPPQSVADDMTVWLFGTPSGAGKGIAPIGISGRVITSTPTNIDIDLSCNTLCPASSAATLKEKITLRLKELVCSGGRLCKSDIDFVIKSFLGRGCLVASSFGFDPAHVTDTGPDLVFECGFFPVLRNLTFIGP